MAGISYCILLASKTSIFFTLHLIFDIRKPCLKPRSFGSVVKYIDFIRCSVSFAARADDSLISPPSPLNHTDRL